MSFESVSRELSIDNAWSHIRHITDEMPSRLAGSANGRRMAEYAQEQFSRAGLESRLHEFLGLVSFPEPVRLRVLAPEQREIAGHTLGHSAPTDGLEGEVIYVGSGAESEYEGQDARGKITLSELSYSPARHEKAYIAVKRGSIAQIMMNWGDETNEAIPFGSMKSAWGNPTPEALETEMPDIPCVGIARTEGLRLKELCARGPVRVWLEAKAENGWKPLTMTSADLDAAGERQFMLLGGHLDSWFGPQATDNAAGNACIMELARVFARRRDELRRGLVCGLWMGHETGTMISSTRFADTNWDRLRRRCVAYLQIDQPGMTGSSTWHLHSTDDVQTFLSRVTQEVVGALHVHWRRQPKTGDASFFGVGLPMLAGEMSFTDEQIKRTALATLGWWHHSIENTIDKVDRKLMELHLRVYARWMWGLLTEPVLPFEYAPFAGRFVDRLTQLAAQPVPEIELASVVDRARELQELATQLDKRAAAVRSRLADGPGEDAEANRLNGAMIVLSRLLVPVASTVAQSYG
ncbi:MAG: M28 family peptidase, partial [Chloroflexi bacterium]|nr:M28 family peptidase [Chloroflexota bacterium]